MEMGNFALIIVDQGSIFWMRKYQLQILVSFYD